MNRSASASTSLLGKAKELEVAGALVRNGLYVFFPLVDAGFDLVVTNRLGTEFIPVQVKYRAKDPGLGLKRSDIDIFQGSRVVVAWVIGAGASERRWYIPFSDWREKAKDLNRADGLVYVSIGESESWLSKYAEDSGIRHSFRSLLVK